MINYQKFDLRLPRIERHEIEIQMLKQKYQVLTCIAVLIYWPDFNDGNEERVRNTCKKKSIKAVK